MSMIKLALDFFSTDWSLMHFLPFRKLFLIVCYVLSIPFFFQLIVKNIVNALASILNKSIYVLWQTIFSVPELGDCYTFIMLSCLAERLLCY